MHCTITRCCGDSASGAPARWTGIISISDAVTKFARAHLGPAAAPVESHMTHGIDPDQYLCHRTHQPGTMKVAIVARLAAQKGHHVLLDAIQEVAKSIPSVHLLVIGHEDDLTIAELRGYAHQIGIKDNVSFLGFRANIAELTEDTDLFVLPSLWEGFGLVLIEAMALGLPVVASSVGPIPEIVLDGQSGRLVPPGNALALADAIRGLLESPEIAFAMGNAGRERVKTAFSIQKMVGEIERVYAELSPSLTEARVA